MSVTESATEPKDLEQLCEMQEGLLQRCHDCLEFELAREESLPSASTLRLLDDLRAHVDPDAPPPADVRLLASANVYLHGLIDRYAAAFRAAENVKDLTREIWEERHAAHAALLHASRVGEP